MKCQCAYCKNDLPFELPSEIIDAAMAGELVIFAGAGISTESKLVFKETLYEDVIFELKLEPNVDFPSAMTAFCNQKNGRKLLLEKIHHRFEYAKQFKEIYRVATRFHNELSSIYSIDKIITTNWDDYFERECNAVPIVAPEDFAFYNIESRKVFKIHGSISNYGSIVATKYDYEKCYKNLQKGIVGSHLKTVLATRTVLFIGYSFSDFDFNKVYNYLKREMGEIIPHYYIVTIDPKFEEKFNKEKATIILTSGTFFLSTLRKHLEGINFLIPKSHLENVEEFYLIRQAAHKRSAEYFFANKTPTGIYNLFYQDGMKHAFDYLLFHSKSGKSLNPHHIKSAMRSYEILKKKMLKVKNYPDYAYVEGYIVGLMSIVYENTDAYFPFFYIMGLGPVQSFKDYSKYLRKKSCYHKAADTIGKKYFQNVLDKESTTIPQHRPFIGGG